MGESRRGEREPGKSDQIDALAVARAVVRDGVEHFPAALWTSARWRSGCSADHRNDLVAERTRMQNRLRWHLLALCPELEARLPRRSLDRPPAGARRPRAAALAAPARACGSPASW